MSDYELHHGDMLEVMPTLAKGSVAMVFADLPYGITKNKWDTVPVLDLFWLELNRIRWKNAAICCTSTQPFTTSLIQSNLQKFRYDLVWEKNSPTQFFNARKMPLRKHESILLFYEKLPTFNPQKTQGVPYLRNKNRTAGRMASRNYGTMPKNMTKNVTGERFPVSVIRLKTTGKNLRLHPTQKPVALLEWLIATYTNPGDTVLDPCFGSNTTGVACARLGRKYIGIEKDAEYFRIGKERLEREVEALRTSPAQGRLAV